MRITMRCQFVSAIGNFTDQTWMAFRDPPENEKCASNLELVEYVQEAFRVAMHTALHGVPG